MSYTLNEIISYCKWRNNVSHMRSNRLMLCNYANEYKYWVRTEKMWAKIVEKYWKIKQNSFLAIKRNSFTYLCVLGVAVLIMYSVSCMTKIIFAIWELHFCIEIEIWNVFWIEIHLFLTPEVVTSTLDYICWFCIISIPRFPILLLPNWK